MEGYIPVLVKRLTDIKSSEMAKDYDFEFDTSQCSCGSKLFYVVVEHEEDDDTPTGYFYVCAVCGNRVGGVTENYHYVKEAKSITAMIGMLLARIHSDELDGHIEFSKEFEALKKKLREVDKDLGDLVEQLDGDPYNTKEGKFEISIRRREKKDVDPDKIEKKEVDAL